MKPLLNKTIVLTGADIPEAYLHDLQALGAKATHIPLIQLESFTHISTQTREYNWVVFTSSAAVKSAPNNLIGPQTHIATIGPTTSEAVRQAGWVVDYESPEHTAEALGKELPIVAGESIAFPCSSKASKLMEELLIQRGCTFDRIECYTTRTRALSVHELEELKKADTVVIMSGTAGISLHDQIDSQSIPNILSIGPSTSAMAKKLGLNIYEEASPHNWSGILNSLAKNN